MDCEISIGVAVPDSKVEWDLKVIVDDCLSESSLRTLRKIGYEPIRIDAICPDGKTDEDVFQYAIKMQVPLVTHNREFEKIHQKCVKDAPTVIIIDVVGPHPQETNLVLEKGITRININSAQNRGKVIKISPRWKHGK